MKKLVSLLIVVAMIVSSVAACIITASAAGGDFFVSIKKEDWYLDEEDQKSVPGYIYTEDGLSINPLGEGYEEYRASWPNNTPYYSVQTASEESLLGGFYMEVRIDAFSISDLDKWLGFSVWDSHGLQLGQVGTDQEGREFGNGVETLIRLNPDTNHAERMSWFDDTEMVEPGRRGVSPANNNYPTMYKEDENGYQIVALAIEYIAEEDLYSYKINDVEAPLEFRQALTFWLQERGNKAYVGFSIQSAVLNGDASVTITKIGDNKEFANAPIGDEDDWVKAVQRDNAVAPIVPKAEADLEEGAPAIWVSAEDSNSYKSITSLGGNTSISITEDGNFKFSLTGSDCADPVVRVPNTVSFDVKEFPIGIVVLKNYCTCAYTDINENGVIDDFEKGCSESEMISMFYHAGAYTDGMDVRTVYQLRRNLTTVDAYGNTYTVYYVDLTLDAEKNEGPQRIHGFMPRFNYIKYQEIGRGEFEVLAFAYFASIEDVETYVKDYFEANLDMEEIPEDTEAPDINVSDTEEIATDAPTEETVTEAPAGPDMPEADAYLEIDQIVDLGNQMEKGQFSEFLYNVSGTVVEIVDAATGAMKIADADGNELFITATFDIDGVTAYGDMAFRPVKGDFVYLYGVIGNDGTPCMKDAMITYFEEGETPETEAPVETDPVETDPVETDPVETDSVEIDSAETDPVETDPVDTDPVETDPVETDPVETDPVDTDPVVTDPVETDPDTQTVTETETETEVKTEAKTDVKTEEKTEEKTEPEDEEPAHQGCGSVAGFGAMAIVAVAAISLVSFKKKED